MSIFSARARLGKAIDRTLLYGTGGIAWLRGSYKILGQNFDDSITGWVAGAGVEHKYALDIDTISIGVG
ncbi:MAG: outer membrane protein [Nitratireductor sp.]